MKSSEIGHGGLKSEASVEAKNGAWGYFWADPVPGEEIKYLFYEMQFCFFQICFRSVSASETAGQSLFMKKMHYFNRINLSSGCFPGFMPQLVQNLQAFIKKYDFEPQTRSSLRIHPEPAIQSKLVMDHYGAH